MTPDVGKRAPFELLAFTAAPVAGGLIVVKLEGRFMPENGRFTRQPMLVVEPDDDRPRLELAPVRARRDDGRWRGVYAIPAEAMPDARLALGVRGTLLELPAPDEPDGNDRLSVLAREANNLRRALETAEADAVTARAEAEATAAELRAAVLAARDGTLAESADRIAALEAELAEARRSAVEQIDAARAAAIVEQEDAVAEARARTEAAEQRVTDAEARAEAAKKAARAAESGTEVLRAELAEERERTRAVVAEDPDATAVHRPAARSGRPGPTAVEPVAPTSLRAGTPDRSPTHWIAVGALVLFAFVLLGLLAGFLG
ncbi:MAG TPA: hypothetical protein VFY45_06570 [Baekduia sp.]|nr:hypothetical protein [Baekduia sp.]